MNLNLYHHLFKNLKISRMVEAIFAEFGVNINSRRSQWGFLIQTSVWAPIREIIRIPSSYRFVSFVVELHLVLGGVLKISQNWVLSPSLPLQTSLWQLLECTVNWRYGHVMFSHQSNSPSMEFPELSSSGSIPSYNETREKKGGRGEGCEKLGWEREHDSNSSLYAESSFGAKQHSLSLAEG